MNGMTWLLLLPVIALLSLFIGYLAQKLATARNPSMGRSVAPAPAGLHLAARTHVTTNDDKLSYNNVILG